MKRVESSHVWFIGYEDGALLVRYHPSVACPEGRLVRYLGVDQKTAQSVIDSPSVGSALHATIRGKYEEVQE